MIYSMKNHKNLSKQQNKIDFYDETHVININMLKK